jgi:hypothetical protein
MSLQFLPIYIAYAEYEAETILNQSPMGSLTWKQALGIGVRFQIIAVGYYLLLYDLAAFQEYLSRSVIFI